MITTNTNGFNFLQGGDFGKSLFVTKPKRVGKLYFVDPRNTLSKDIQKDVSMVYKMQLAKIDYKIESI